jgi:hypothetical protein
MSNGPQPRTGNDPDFDALAADASTNLLVGVLAAMGLIGCGTYMFVRGEVPFVPEASVRYHHQYALGMGIMAVGAGLFLHFRVFWELRRPDMWYTTLGQIVGLLGIIGGAVVVGLRFFRAI